jgi:hypothetical protein
MNVKEREPGLRIATRPDPALDRGARADGRPAREDVDDAICMRHEVLLPARGMHAASGRDRGDTRWAGVTRSG